LLFFVENQNGDRWDLRAKKLPREEELCMVSDFGLRKRVIDGPACVIAFGADHLLKTMHPG